MVGEHAEVLGEVANTFPGRRVVVIGAAALRWHFPRFRGTMDLDLCVAMDRQEHADNTLFPASWRRSPRLPHRWHRSEHAWLRAAAPAAWRAEATVFSRRFEALCAGLGEP